MSQSDTGAALVTLTPAAVRQVKHLIQRRGDPSLGLRVGVKGGGCSGLSYVMSLEPAPREGDHVLEVEGLRVFVDPRSARFVEGTTIDFSLSNFLDGGFKFQNPNAARSCGCGTSFTPKD